VSGWTESAITARLVQIGLIMFALYAIDLAERGGAALAPLTGPLWIVLGPVLYLCALWFLQARRRSRGDALEDTDWRDRFMYHHLYLAAMSGILWIGLAVEVARGLYGGGLVALMGWCDVDEGTSWSATGFYGYEEHRARLWSIMYVHYMLKYIELGGSILIVLDGHPVPLVQIYLHASTLALALTPLLGPSSIQWWVAGTKLAADGVMHVYYLSTVTGDHPEWKRLLTQVQIAQCAVALVATAATIVAPHLGFATCRRASASSSTHLALFILASHLPLLARFYTTAHDPRRKKSH
jgi:hypothetical protein